METVTGLFAFGSAPSSTTIWRAAVEAAWLASITVSLLSTSRGACYAGTVPLGRYRTIQYREQWFDV